MRIILIGAVEFSLSMLEHLHALNACIVGVCTLPQSKFNADHVDLAQFSKLHGIPYLYVEDINSPTTLKWIRQKSPDIIFCFGWSFLIKQELLKLPPMGILGFHPAALPLNRGRHPIIWALALGLSRTASTFFFMDEGADSGDIVSQRAVEISSEDDARALYNKITEIAKLQITELLPKLADKSFFPVSQDSSLANYWRKRQSEDGKIDWRMSADAINNLVRALTSPYCGAHFYFNNIEIKVWKVELVSNVVENVEPGKVLATKGMHPIIKCGVGALKLLSMSPNICLLEGEYL